MFNSIKSLFQKEKTDFAKLVGEGAVILDVRTPSEFESGHIKGSRNLPLDRIQSQLSEIKKLNKPIITVCRSGGRSAAAKSILASAGLTVYNGGPWNVLKNRIK